MTLVQQYRLCRGTDPDRGRMWAIRRAWYYWKVMGQR